MAISVGTFNLNNLFSRYNFKAEIASLEDLKEGVKFESHMEAEDGEVFKVRSYQGRLVNKKDVEDSAIIAERIKRMNLDVLCVQEVEDRDTLKEFNMMMLNTMYSFVGLIEGNDPRLIDVGILSKLPIGGITSWQFAVHPDAGNRPIFSRDVLEVEILNMARSKVLFKVFNTHLKSHYVDFKADPEEGANQANATRKKQAEILRNIIKHGTRPGGNYIVTGDMNDPVESEFLGPFTMDEELGLKNGLVNAEETQPYKDELPIKAWTHRFKESGKPAHYELFDHVWLSEKLREKQTGAFIDRRTLSGGDGSDHDPSWVVLDNLEN